MMWRVGDPVISTFPARDDAAVCEICGKVGQVGLEIFMAFGISVISAFCRDCYGEGGNHVL
jgi:hypothetical protein